MDTIHEEIAALAVEQVDFQNADLEASQEGTLVAYGKLFSTALEIGKSTDGEAEEVKEATVSVARGVLSLARQFGVAFKNLNATQREAVSAAIKQVVTGANEALIEAFFDAALDFIIKQQENNALVDSLVAVDPDEA